MQKGFLENEKLCIIALPFLQGTAWIPVLAMVHVSSSAITMEIINIQDTLEDHFLIVRFPVNTIAIYKNVIKKCRNIY